MGDVTSRSGPSDNNAVAQLGQIITLAHASQTSLEAQLQDAEGRNQHVQLDTSLVVCSMGNTVLICDGLAVLVERVAALDAAAEQQKCVTSTLRSAIQTHLRA